jgi:hypothetical protein
VGTYSKARAFARYGGLDAPDPLCPFNSGNEGSKRTKFISSPKREKSVLEPDWKAFTVQIGDAHLRVRKESFGGTVYLPGREQQIYVNEDGYVVFEALQKTQDTDEVIEELKKRNISIDEGSVQAFLDQLFQIPEAHRS